MQPTQCPLCNRSANGRYGNSGWWQLSCERCGGYIIPERLLRLFADHVERCISTYNPHLSQLKAGAILSFAVRQMNHSGEYVTITPDLVADVIKNTHLPTPMEQVDRLIMHLGSRLLPGETMQLLESNLGGVVGAVTDDGFRLLLDYLRDNGLIACERHSGENAGLSVSGWSRFHELQRTRPDSRTAFMAMPFNEPELDDIVLNNFKPAVQQTGFELVRGDERQRAGLIDDQLRVAIRLARFVIADISHGNSGAYWEAGYAEGLGKPVIYTCRADAFKEMAHFDTNHHLTVQWEPESPAEACDKLKATIRATFPADAALTDE